MAHPQIINVDPAEFGVNLVKAFCTIEGTDRDPDSESLILEKDYCL